MDDLYGDSEDLEKPAAASPDEDEDRDGSNDDISDVSGTNESGGDGEGDDSRDAGSEEDNSGNEEGEIPLDGKLYLAKLFLIQSLLIVSEWVISSLELEISLEPLLATCPIKGLDRVELIWSVILYICIRLCVKW